MKILVTNDDGIRGEGLWALATAFKNFGHDVTVAAPSGQQSATSHALSVMHEIEYKKFSADCDAWAFDGTPTDCVKIFLEGMTTENFDAVVSGINDGPNLATDVLYSGTVGAALEGFLHAIPSLAVSIEKNSAIALNVAASVTADYLEKNLRAANEPFLHNINFPKNFRADPAEFAVTRLGRRDYVNAFKFRTDDAGRKLVYIAGKSFDSDCGEGTDIHAVNCGLVSVTPLIVDATNYAAIAVLQKNFRG